MERTPGPCTGPRTSRSGQPTPAHIRDGKVPNACYNWKWCLPLCCRFPLLKLALLFTLVLPEHCSAVLLVVAYADLLQQAPDHSLLHRKCQAQSLLVLTPPHKATACQDRTLCQPKAAPTAPQAPLPPACKAASAPDAFALSRHPLLAPCSPASDHQRRHGCLK